MTYYGYDDDDYGATSSDMMMSIGKRKAEVTCIMCKRVFTLEDGEVDFYAQRGLDQPKRCQPCRAVRKAHAVREGDRQPIQPLRRPINNKVECHHCNRLTVVPFTPREGSEVYCRVCWEGVKIGGTTGALYV